MKLVLISPYYSSNPSGANKRFEAIVSSCERLLGEDLYVVTPHGEQVTREGAKSKSVFIPFNSDSGPIGRVLVYLWLNVFQAFCFLKGAKVITDFNPVTIVQFFSSKQYQLIHDARVFSDFGRWNVISKSVMAFFWRRLSKIVTVSHASKELLVSNLNIDPDKIVVSYNGIGSASQNFKNCSINKDIDLLYVATFEKRKNHLTLLKSLMLVNEQLNVCFVGYDNGYKHEIDAFIKDNHLIHNIEIYSGLSEQELSELYLRAKLFVYPSLYEGFGMPLIEAASIGSRIVCSNLNVFKELMKDYPVYFDPNNPVEIADVICKNINVSDSTKNDFDLTPFIWDSIALSLLKDIGLLDGDENVN